MLNNSLNPASSKTINVKKKAVNRITASVRLQADRRLGQRTCRSSIQAPLKYLPMANNGLVRNFGGFGNLNFFAVDLITAINLLFLTLPAFILVSFGELFLRSFFTIFSPKINSLLQADCQVLIYLIKMKTSIGVNA